MKSKQPKATKQRLELALICNIEWYEW